MKELYARIAPLPGISQYDAQATHRVAFYCDRKYTPFGFFVHDYRSIEEALAATEAHLYARSLDGIVL